MTYFPPKIRSCGTAEQFSFFFLGRVDCPRPPNYITARFRQGLHKNPLYALFIARILKRSVRDRDLPLVFLCLGLVWNKFVCVCRQTEFLTIWSPGTLPTSIVFFPDLYGLNKKLLTDDTASLFLNKLQIHPWIWKLFRMCYPLTPNYWQNPERREQGKMI